MKKSRLNRLKIYVATLAACPVLMAMGAAAQEEAKKPATVADYPRPLDYPKENKAQVAEYLAQARAIAQNDLYGDFVHRCITDARYRQRVNALQFNGLLPPTKVFDQLYFVGQNAVSAWALDTSDGIILFDALNNTEEAREILVPGLRAVGLDPARIKYIVITHSHGDHYGGAEYLRDTYGARLISSQEDWDAMDRMRASGTAVGPFALPPKKDMVIKDGETFTVGKTALTFYVTPGHTTGTVSTLFPVTDNGKPHVVAFFGGFGAPRDPQQRYTHIASMDRFAAIAKRAGADSMIANHPVQDGGFEKMEMLRYRRAGDPNPFVIGADRLGRYFGVQATCSKAGLARVGLPVNR